MGIAPLVNSSSISLQINWCVIGAPVVDGIANISADEDSIVAKVSSHFRRNVRGTAHGHHVDNFHIFDVRTALHQSFDQRFRFRAARLNVDAHSGLDTSQSFLRRAKFFLVINFPRHCVHSPGGCFDLLLVRSRWPRNTWLARKTVPAIAETQVHRKSLRDGPRAASRFKKSQRFSLVWIMVQISWLRGTPCCARRVPIST